MRECLVQETKTLIEKSGVHKITSVFFGGGMNIITMLKIVYKAKNKPSVIVRRIF